jgi:hypothetical protein
MVCAPLAREARRLLRVRAKQVCSPRVQLPPSPISRDGVRAVSVAVPRLGGCWSAAGGGRGGPRWLTPDRRQLGTGNHDVYRYDHLDRNVEHKVHLRAGDRFRSGDCAAGRNCLRDHARRAAPGPGVRCGNGGEKLGERSGGGAAKAPGQSEGSSPPTQANPNPLGALLSRRPAWDAYWASWYGHAAERRGRVSRGARAAVWAPAGSVGADREGRRGERVNRHPLLRNRACLVRASPRRCGRESTASRPRWAA